MLARLRLGRICILDRWDSGITRTNYLTQPHPKRLAAACRRLAASTGTAPKTDDAERAKERSGRAGAKDQQGV